MELKFTIDSFIQIIKDTLLNTNWLFEPLSFGGEVIEFEGMTITPIMFLSFSFLIVLLGLAVFKWLAS